jgi:hypothetical protein
MLHARLIGEKPILNNMYMMNKVQKPIVDVEIAFSRICPFALKAV